LKAFLSFGEAFRQRAKHFEQFSGGASQHSHLSSLDILHRVDPRNSLVVGTASFPDPGALALCCLEQTRRRVRAGQ
jgi:hypothetical protein